jgi:hypothetical protein
VISLDLRRLVATGLNWAAVGGLVVVAIATGTVAVDQLAWASFNPTNGSFQNWNALHRISLGQIPGIDFTIYLGFGPTLLAYPFAALAGVSYAGTTAILFILHHVAFAVAGYVLGRLAGLSRAPAIVAASTLFCLASLNLDIGSRILDLTRLLLNANTSAIGLRAFLPFVTVGLLRCIWRWRAQWLTGIRGAATVGVIAGAQPLWSNDYGPPSAVLLLLLGTVFLVDWRRPREAIRILSVLVVGAALGFVVCASLVTLGHPLTWARENFIDIASDQYWLFVMDASRKVFSLEDIPLTLWKGAAVASAGVLILAAYRDRRRVGYLALGYIGLVSAAAGFLSYIGGMSLDRYFAGLARASFFVIPAGTVAAYRMLDEAFHIPVPAAARWLRPAFGLVGLCVAVYAIASLAFSGSALIKLRGLERGKAGIVVAELGGSLPENHREAVDFARRVRREMDAAGVPADRRLFSTYATAIDAIAGAVQPTRQDYIIHALGQRNRSSYLETFIKGRYQYATTPNPDLIVWETWNERVNWWFYRELYRRYAPVEDVSYARIWKLRSEPLPPLDEPIECRVESTSDNAVMLHIGSDLGNEPTELAGNVAHGTGSGAVYVEVRVNYSVDLETRPIPILGQRWIAQATDIHSARQQGIGGVGEGTFALSNITPTWVFPVLHRLGGMSTVKIEVYPENRADLTIHSCSARTYVDAEATRPAEEEEASHPIAVRTVRYGASSLAIVVRPRSSKPYLGIILENPPLDVLRPDAYVEHPCIKGQDVLAVTYPPATVWLRGKPEDDLAKCLGKDPVITLRLRDEDAEKDRPTASAGQTSKAREER